MLNTDAVLVGLRSLAAISHWTWNSVITWLNCAIVWSIISFSSFFHSLALFFLIVSSIPLPSSLISWSNWICCASTPQWICLSPLFEMIKLRSSLGSDPILGYCRQFLLLISFFNIFSSPSHAECYYPDGSIEQNNEKEYQPCDPGDEHSMCCATNRTKADRCRGDGFCFSTWDLNLWREGCTDPTWKSPRCNKVCIAGKGIRNIFEQNPLKL